MRRLIATGVISFLLIGGCHSGPQYHASTCDFLVNPAKYADQDLEFCCEVSRDRAGKFWLISGCIEPSLKSFPLRWRDGVVYPEGITEKGNLSFGIEPGNVVMGRLKSSQQNGFWFIEATDYQRRVYTM